MVPVAASHMRARLFRILFDVVRVVSCRKGGEHSAGQVSGLVGGSRGISGGIDQGKKVRLFACISQLASFDGGGSCVEFYRS